LFSDETNIHAFHPSGIWVSGDGETWGKTDLTNIVKNTLEKMKAHQNNNKQLSTVMFLVNQ